MTDKKSPCAFCGVKAYDSVDEAMQAYKEAHIGMDRQNRYKDIKVERIIKAAIQAIEDVVESDCTYFTEEHLKPHLEALKGLTDD
jgi:hypothetical protein